MLPAIDNGKLAFLVDHALDRLNLFWLRFMESVLPQWVGAIVATRDCPGAVQSMDLDPATRRRKSSHGRSKTRKRDGKLYGNKVAVREVSFSCRERRVSFDRRPDGAGKSTILKNAGRHREGVLGEDKLQRFGS